MLDAVEGDRLARHNARVLAIGQALAGANASVVVATGALLGQMLAPGSGLATLAISTFVLGTALFTYPASAFMKRVGRRAGFMLGGLLGVAGGLLGALAIWQGSFWLFVLSATVSGAYQSFIVLYRYAAADTATPAFRPKAISWVLLGGVAASFVGPQLVILTKDILTPLTFAATYLCQAAFAAIAIIVTGMFRDGPVITTAAAGAARHLGEILRNAKLLVAIFCGMVSQAMMNMVMTATPIAMVGCGFTVTDSTLGIQWHMLAMYLPSFYTGNLIARFGRYPMMLVGLSLLVVTGLINLYDIKLMNFWGALVMLGLGWNFSFIAATAMVTDCHAPAERAKVQGFTDFTIFTATTFASFMAGYLYETLGWKAVNWSLIPISLAAIAAVIWLAMREKSTRSAG